MILSHPVLPIIQMNVVFVMVTTHPVRMNVVLLTVTTHPVLTVLVYQMVLLMKMNAMFVMLIHQITVLKIVRGYGVVQLL